MTLPVRASIISAAIAVVFSGFVFACPQTTRDLGLDIWHYSEEEQKLDECKRRYAELESLGETVLQRVSLKSTIVQDVIEGRVTLAEASEQFLALNRVRPSLIPAVRIVYPASSDEESSARQVVSYVRVRSKSDPKATSKALERLEAEFAKLYAHG